MDELVEIGGSFDCISLEWPTGRNELSQQEVVSNPQIHTEPTVEDLVTHLRVSVNTAPTSNVYDMSTAVHHITKSLHPILTRLESDLVRVGNGSGLEQEWII